MRTRRSTASPWSSSHPLSPRVTCCATALAGSEHPRPYSDPPSTRLASPSPSSSPLLLVLISLARHGSRRLVQRSAQDQGFRSGQAHGQPERHAPVRPPPLPRLVPLVPSSAQPSSLASQPLDPAGKPTRKRPRRQRRTRRRRRSTECASVLPPGSSHRARPLDVLLTLSLSDCSDAMPTSLFFSHNEALVPPYRVIVDTNFINLSLENRVDIVKSMMDVLYAKGAFQPLLSKPRERSDVDLAPAHAAIPCISDCVLAELEKLGHQYRLALRCVLPLPPLTGPQDSVLTMLLPRPRPSRFALAPRRPRPPRPPPPPSPPLAPLSVARDPRFERLPCSHKGTYADDCIVNRVTQHRCYIVATCDRQLRRRLRKVPGVPVRALRPLSRASVSSQCCGLRTRLPRCVAAAGRPRARADASPLAAHVHRQEALRHRAPPRPGHRLAHSCLHARSLVSAASRAGGVDERAREECALFLELSAALHRPRAAPLFSPSSFCL